MPKEQIIRYSDEELLLLKNTFADNTDLLKALRKVFLQQPLREREEILIINTIRERKSVFELVKKAFLPVIDGDAPLNQITDLWYAFDFASKTPEEAMPHIHARQLFIEYFEQQLDNLESGKEEKIKFEKLLPTKNADISFIYLLARNSIVQHVEQHLMELKMLAGRKEETPEQTLKRLSQNSNK